MKIPSTKNKHRKPKRQDEQEEFDSDNILSEPENIQQNAHPKEDHRTPEQVKIAIAKKLIQKTKAKISDRNQRVKGRDQFFIEDINQNEQNGVRSKNNVQTEDGDMMAEELKNQYLRSKNKLYINQQQQFKDIKFSEPTVYKGHTKCITGFYSTQDKIYSVSKDRSIIAWDRETGKKDFITMAKQNNKIDHQSAILCMDYHEMHQMIATAGEDGKIKLWDVRSLQLIDTLKGHRHSINGIKFGGNSSNLCSVSKDLTMKQWECAQRGIIQTYYGHNGEILDIDNINESDFVSSGNDHQNIVWKTQKQTQIIFQGHQYAIDRVRSINQQKFVSACQDGSINLWSQKKKKPIYKHASAHSSWIGALDCIKQSNIFASGACDGVVKIWSIGEDLKKFSVLKEIQTKGIVTDIKLNGKEIIFTNCDEHRLGRWLTSRIRNQIQVYRFSHQ